MTEKTRRMREDPSVGTCTRVLQALPFPVAILGDDDRVVDCSDTFPAWLAGDPPTLPKPLRTAAADARASGGPVVREIEWRGSPARLTAAPVSPGQTIVSVDECPSPDLAGALRRRTDQMALVNGIITTALSPLPLDEMLCTCLWHIVALLDFDGGAVYLINRRTGLLECRAFAGVSDLYHPPGIRDPAALPHREIYQEGRSQFFEEYLDTEHEEGELGVYSVAQVPIRDGDTVLGSFFVASSSFHRFSPLEKDVLETVGREMGASIHRRMILEEREEANQWVDLCLDIIEHDINNANTVSLGTAALLREEVEEDLRPRVDRLIAGIEQSTRIIHNISLVRSYTDDPGTRWAIDLDRVVAHACAQFPHARIHTTPSGCLVRADALLEQVFINLLGKSVKYGPADVEISIRTETDDGMVRVWVEDDGPGIPDEVKSAVFDRFARGTSVRSGLGLGLYIVRMLVTRYGGEISVADRVAGFPGEGTAFTITLPLAPEE